MEVQVFDVLEEGRLSHKEQACPSDISVSVEYKFFQVHHRGRLREQDHCIIADLVVCQVEMLQMFETGQFGDYLNGCVCYETEVLAEVEVADLRC